jgi:hypothetical protein
MTDFGIVLWIQLSVLAGATGLEVMLSYIQLYICTQAHTDYERYKNLVVKGGR